MPVRAPLSVKVNDGIVQRDVSRYVTGLKFRKTAPGGDHSIECNLDLPRDYFTDLGGGDTIKVDGPTARTVIQGYLDNPGRIDGASGQGFDLVAMGVQVIAHDRRQALFYRDTDLNAYDQPSSSTITKAQVGTGDDPTAALAGDGLLMQLVSGQAVGTGTEARGSYKRLASAGLEVGAFRFDHKSGMADANYRVQIVGAYSLVPATTLTSVSRFIGDVGSFSLGATVVEPRLVRSGAATNVATDTVWTWFTNVAVMQRRMDRYGTLVTGTAGMVTADYVRADWVVEDLLGRMLSQIDKGSAVVEVPSVPAQIDQLALPDGATAGEVLDHLLEHEPNFLWEIGAGFRFAWRQWPTTARYEISTADGFDQPGGEYELCNRVTVAWTDASGNPRTTVVWGASSSTATVGGFGIGAVATVFAPSLASLEQTGRIKDAETVELPDGRGSEANALRIGQAVLAATANPPKSATATVRRPIVDLLKGGRVMPWEVEPGYLVRVRETGDLIRLTETEYDDDEGSVTLTLGNPQRDIEDVMATLPQVQRRVA